MLSRRPMASLSAECAVQVAAECSEKGTQIEEEAAFSEVAVQTDIDSAVAYLVGRPSFEDLLGAGDAGDDEVSSDEGEIGDAGCHTPPLYARALVGAGTEVPSPPVAVSSSSLGVARHCVARLRRPTSRRCLSRKPRTTLRM